MCDALRSRGPDDAGTWIDSTVGISLGHRRLSVLDLSPEGHQPMVSANGRYQIVYNGEIYNHHELRDALGTQAWRGHSDTEILLAGIERWGVAATLRRLVGMYAFALWDREERTLTLARDRLGEKPLYYGWFGDTLLFGSELKALRAHPQCHAEVDRNALASYLRYGYVPGPHTIYRNVRKLPPGTLLTLRDNNATTVEPIAYWSALDAALSAHAQPFTGSDEDAANALESLLLDAVSKECIADVPLGAFLSGGIDSSLIVALMQKQARHPVRTFTIGFSEAGYNEAPYAAAVARHLGTEHTELTLSGTEAQAVIPDLAKLYDEPFADSSQIPTHLVCRMARQHVTVSMSGDGGDELFGGYNRHVQAPRLWRAAGRLPAALRGLAASSLTAVSPQHWDAIGRGWSKLSPGGEGAARLGDKLHKLAGALRADTPEALYQHLVSQWQSPASITLQGREPHLRALSVPGLGIAEQMMLADTMQYLPDDILVKVDRAAMGVSLETRAPYLDHRIMEFAWHLPLDMKIRNGQGKWLLRQVLYRHVPKALIERPKMGFGIPIDSWLRGALRDWAEHLLDAKRLQQEGWFDPVPIRQLWEAHLAGRCNAQYPLWTILMFQAWQEEWLK